MERLSEESARLQEEKDSLGSTTGRSREAVEARSREIEQLLVKIGEEKKRAEDISSETDRAMEEKEEKGKRRKQLFQRKDELADRISRLDKESFRLHNQKEKLEEKQEGLVNYMWSEYELTYSTAEALRDENLPEVSELKRRIQELKNQIRGLGNVNVNAIEDYREISGRYEFMKNQHDDLTTAADALYKIIEELDTGMRRQFAENLRKSGGNSTGFSVNCSEADTEVWSWWRTKIFWRREFRLFPSRRGKSCRT